MDLIVAWLIFPLVLAAVALGCGLLVERASGRRFPGVLLPSLGLALVIVVATLMVQVRLTGAVISAVAGGLAFVGYLLGRRRLRPLRIDGWAAGLAAFTLAVMAAPIVLTGDATFFFYLNDTAVQFVLLEWVPEHGRTWAGLDFSSFQATVQGYLSSGYPLGAHLGLAALRPLVGIDIESAYQPYLAFVLVLGALALYALVRPIASRRFSAFAAFVAIQPGLLYAYYLSGTIKEIGMAWVLIVITALAWIGARETPSFRGMIPLALLTATALAVLNLAAVPWIGVPLAFFAAALLWRNRFVPKPRLAAALGGGAVLAVALSAPAIASLDTFRSVTTSVLTNQAELGNLLGPLSPWHLVGIWPSGDFRTSPVDHPALAYALMGIAAAAVVLGGFWTLRRRAGGPLLLAAASGAAVAYLVYRGSPYADAKAMMVGSSAVMLIALLGVQSLREAGRRVEAVLLAAALAGGVLWTNALAYNNVPTAPKDRYGELRSIGERFADDGPALVTEYDPYLSYFTWPLRLIGPALRADTPPRLGLAAKFPYDLDQVEIEQLERLDLVVTRQSPFGSRPPASFRKVWSGEHYEVWRRAVDAPRVIDHFSLGTREQPGARPACDDVRAIAEEAARRTARLAYAERSELIAFKPTKGAFPRTWGLHEDVGVVQPRGEAGVIGGQIEIGSAGRYRIWLQASMVRDSEIFAERRMIGRVDGQIGQPGQILPGGEVRLAGGQHDVRILLDTPGLEPGEDGFPRDRVGQLVFQPVEDALEVNTANPEVAERLCDLRLDWIEIVS